MSAHPPSPVASIPFPLAARQAPGPPGSSPLPPGTRIGGDVVEAVLGSGGFATVYRVRGSEGHVSALKLLPLEEGEERAARAWRELSLGMRLRHPNLARQLGAGQWPLEQPRFVWLKLELIEGPTLEEWGLAPGRTVGEVVERVLEVARALAVMHEAGVVHRDVKEANVLVRESNGQAVLVDFGVSYRQGDRTLTKGLFPPGTLPYRAPEAWAYGRAHVGVAGVHYRAGPADDLYALGVILYRLLTGRFPFRFTDDGWVDVEAVLHRAPLPPHLLNPRVPREVEAVCLRLLAKGPEARYPSAVALYEALEELKAGADASWKEPLHPERRPIVKPWARRGRVLAAVGVGLALALGVWWLGSGQEVAPGEHAPESARAVAPPPLEATPPTVAAPPVASRKDSAPVKPQQQKTPGLPPEMAPRGWGAAVRTACAGLTGVALQACVASQQQVAPSAPPPEACPAGALDTMTRLLELRVGDRKTVEWSDVSGRPVRVDEDTPIRAAGAWEAGADFTGKGYKDALPDLTWFSGRLYVREGRVYGRFTAARTPSGVTYPVCLELLDTGDRVGLELQPGSGPERMMVAPTARVRVVDHFE